jgi:hypothetical protein
MHIKSVFQYGNDPGLYQLPNHDHYSKHKKNMVFHELIMIIFV